MNDLFLNVVNISIRTSYIFLIVIVARVIMKKTPKIYSYILWILFFIFTMIPNIYLNTVNTSGNTKGITISTPAIQNTDTQNASVNLDNNNVGNQPVDNDIVIKLQNENHLLPLITLVWSVVCTLLIMYSMISYIFLKFKLKKAICLYGNIYESNAISTPFVFGIISPKIIIPAAIVEEKREYIISHEQIHIKRLDYIIKTFAYLLTVIHWFNPIMWLSFKLLSQDMEMACDEKVLSQYNDSIKKTYSLALVELAESGNNFVSRLGFGESNVKRRVNHILKYHKTNKKFNILAISILAIICLIFIMLPKDKVVSVAQSSNYKHYGNGLDELTETENNTDDTDETLLSSSALTELPAPPSTTPALPTINSYSNKNVKFDYPSDWILAENPTEDISYVSFFDSNSSANPIFWFSKGEAWLIDFNRTEKDYQLLLSEGYPDIVITDLTKTTIDGYDTIKLVFTYTSQGKEYIMTQYKTIIGYTSFEFSYTYSAEMNNDYISIFESVISSIEFS